MIEPRLWFNGTTNLYYAGAHGLSVGFFHPQALILIKDRAVATV